MRRGGAGKRRDASEPAIIEALEASGWSVTQLHLADGPDLLCGAYQSWVGVAEVKSGKAALRAGQGRWHERWRGAPVRVLRTVDDALAWVKEAANHG